MSLYNISIHTNFYQNKFINECAIERKKLKFRCFRVSQFQSFFVIWKELTFLKKILSLLPIKFGWFKTFRYTLIFRTSRISIDLPRKQAHRISTTEIHFTTINTASAIKSIHHHPINKVSPIIIMHLKWKRTPFTWHLGSIT